MVDSNFKRASTQKNKNGKTAQQDSVRSPLLNNDKELIVEFMKRGEECGETMHQFFFCMVAT